MEKTMENLEYQGSSSTKWKLLHQAIFPQGSAFKETRYIDLGAQSFFLLWPIFLYQVFKVGEWAQCYFTLTHIFLRQVFTVGICFLEHLLSRVLTHPYETTIRCSKSKSNMAMRNQWSGTVHFDVITCVFFHKADFTLNHLPTTSYWWMQPEGRSL